MMERLYTSPTYGMWYPIDPKSLSSNLPPMVVFPESTKFYQKWQADMEKRGVKVSRRVDRDAPSLCRDHDTVQPASMGRNVIA